MSGARCINKITRALCVLLCLFVLSGCGANDTLRFPYRSARLSASLDARDVATPFSAELCVAEGDIPAGGLTFVEDESAALFDVGRAETLFAHSIHERRDPASLTKVMTALVALENGSLDQVLTASTSEYITDEDAQLLVVNEGEQMTLHQALHFLLVYSANDVAMMIAEGVGGDVESFVRLMNEKATSLGATNTHFTNPHGLTDANQYTTAYDMYIIFREAMRHETFQQIISLASYKTEYYRRDHTLKEAEVRNTNAFVRDGSGVTAPAGVTVIGGKTGSTFAAGQCLIVLALDTAGAPYIAIYMHAPSTDRLYEGISDLLRLTGRTSP